MVMQENVTLAAYEQLLDAAVKLREQYETYDERIRQAMCVFGDTASAEKIEWISRKAVPYFTAVLKQSREKVYRTLSEMIRNLKQQYDRCCEMMEETPKVFRISELDYRFVGMEMANGQTVSMVDALAAVDLCSRTLAQLTDADQALLYACRRFEDVFTQVQGELVRQTVGTISETIRSFKTEISTLHARTQTAVSLLNELIKRFSSLL